MPGTIIQFPASQGGGFALVKTGQKKRTVRFVPQGRRAMEPSAMHTDQRRIDGARVTAANYRRIAEKTKDRTHRERMLGLAAKWETRAEKLESTKYGPQQPPGGLFE